MNDDLLVVIDPSGALAGTSTPQRPLLVVVDTIAHLPRWALAVEAAQEEVAVERHLASYPRPAAWPCPHEWLQSACDSDGRSLAWLDVARVSHQLTTGYRTMAVN